MGVSPTTAVLNQEKTMTDFQSFRNAVLKDDDLTDFELELISWGSARKVGQLIRFIESDERLV